MGKMPLGEDKSKLHAIKYCIHIKMHFVQKTPLTNDPLTPSKFLHYKYNSKETYIKMQQYRHTYKHHNNEDHII